MKSIRKIITPIRKLGVVERLGIVGSLASIIGLFVVFVPQDTKPENQPTKSTTGNYNGSGVQVNGSTIGGSIIVQGTDNKEIEELIKILQLRQIEVNENINKFIELEDRDSEYLMAKDSIKNIQTKFNGLMNSLFNAEREHQYILAHQLVIQIHQLGYELRSESIKLGKKADKILKEIAISLSESCDMFDCDPRERIVRNIASSMSRISASFDKITEILDKTRKVD